MCRAPRLQTGALRNSERDLKTVTLKPLMLDTGEEEECNFEQFLFVLKNIFYNVVNMSIGKPNRYIIVLGDFNP